MKKTPSLFKRDYDGNRQVINEVVPGSEWVLDGQGTATLKLDGTACRILDGQLWRRYDRKLNKQAHRRKRKGHAGPWVVEDFKQAPAGFSPCEPEPDQRTGHWPGWVPVSDNPADQYHHEAMTHDEALANTRPDGTYELVGPAIQNNPYELSEHQLWRHGISVLDAPRDFAGLRDYLEQNRIEGIVWHHPDGRLVKIKRRDFGFPWP